MACIAIGGFQHETNTFAPSLATLADFETGDIPFMIPLTWQCTTSEPMRSIMELRDDLEGAEAASLTVAAGFPAADIHHCGPSLFGYGRSQDAVERAMGQIAEEIERREGEFEGVILVGSRKAQLADRAMYRHCGIEPTTRKIYREQELGVLPGRLPAHRLRGADLRGAGADGCRSRRAALDPPPDRGAHPPERPRIRRGLNPAPGDRRDIPANERNRRRVHDRRGRTAPVHGPRHRVAARDLGGPRAGVIAEASAGIAYRTRVL